MKTRLCVLNYEKIDQEVIEEAGSIIKKGGLVAFPTETVYGLGGDALNPSSSAKIYAAKGRPSDNPLIVHIADMESLHRIVKNVPEQAVRLAEAYWPGPLTMIFQKTEEVPLETTGGLQTVAVRMPDDPVALAFIKAAGGYIAAPSANTSGKPSPTLARHVAEDMNGKIEMILDGGAVGIGLESTIVDLTCEKPMILRPGYVTETMIAKVLGEVDTDKTILDNNSKVAPKAPGMKYRHYAPNGELVIVEGETHKVVSYINEKLAQYHSQNAKTGVIATDETCELYEADVVKSAGKRTDEAAIAHQLYAFLRDFDSEQVQYIFAESFATDGVGQAIMNRLLKAAGHKIIHLDE